MERGGSDPIRYSNRLLPQNILGDGEFWAEVTSTQYNLPKGTVSATLNILALGIIALSIEITRWVYFHAGGRIAFHGAALLAGIAVIISVARLLKLREQHQSQSESPVGCQEQ